MESKEFDLLVFIGKMRPFHKGHKHVIDTGLAKAHNVLVLVGSANRPRTPELPWTAEEVEGMIRSVYPIDTEDGGRITIEPLDDWMHDNDFHWTIDVQRKVKAASESILALRGHEGPKLRIGLIGYSKDRTSYYLKKFPQWGSIDVGPFRHKGKVLNATDIRTQYFQAPGTVTFAQDPVLDRGVLNYLNLWTMRNGDLVRDLQASVQFSSDYKADFRFVGEKASKLDPTHTTTDAVVIQSGHVLLIRRKFLPGKGLWALPGGFLKKHNEYIREGVTRELKEETKLGLTSGVLNLAFRFKLVFSDPNRGDSRGRIITHAYLYLLNDRRELPAIEASDDADRAEWVPLGDLDPRFLYSDHYWIIQKMIAMIPID